MMMVLRRLLLLVTLMFWQGGFMFYGAVVVPIGSEVLGSHQEQGWITRSVTNYLNLAGAVALAVWGWDILAARTASHRNHLLRWLAWTLLVLTLGLLAWLHLRLDALLDPEALRILSRPNFRALHRWYLNISTLQWAVSLALTALTIQAWRDGDSRCGGGTTSRPDE